MRSVSAWFQAEMVKTSLHPFRRFSYNDVFYTDYVENYTPVELTGKRITSGVATIGLINTDKTFNFFLDDESNIRNTGVVEFALGSQNGRIARAGCAMSGASISDLVSPHSLCYLTIWTPKEWVEFFTGVGDETHFKGAYLNLHMRDKMALMLQKVVGSEEVPVSYFAADWNPADLVWHLLTVYGELDNTADETNVDIDYERWSNWWDQCDDLGLLIRARLTGQTVGEILNRVAYLTHSFIFVRGDGKMVFYRFSPAEGVVATFDDDNTRDQEVQQTLKELLNDITVYHTYDPATGNFGGSVNVIDATSQGDYWRVPWTVEDKVVWAADVATARDFALREITDYKDPREYCIFTTGIEGFVLEPADLVYNNISFWGYSNDIFELYNSRLDLNTGLARITIARKRTIETGGFILDDPYWGLLAKLYNPLY